MNRDISQLTALLAQMQSNIARQQTGISGLAKDIQKLATSVDVLDSNNLSATVAKAASIGAAKEVSKAADSAKRASDCAEAIFERAGTMDRKRRRWKIAVIVLAVTLVFVAGAGSSLLITQTQRYGCLAYGGEWITKPGLTACLLR